VNLTGELVDLRPTERTIALLTSSRVQPTLALREAAARLDAVWLQASTAAIHATPVRTSGDRWSRAPASRSTATPLR
jgi:hypothetical protein